MRQGVVDGSSVTKNFSTTLLVCLIWTADRGAARNANHVTS